LSNVNTLVPETKLYCIINYIKSMCVKQIHIFFDYNHIVVHRKDGVTIFSIVFQELCRKWSKNFAFVSAGKVMKFNFSSWLVTAVK